MAEDKGKSGGVGGFVPGGADFGKAEKPGFGGGGKHESGKPEKPLMGNEAGGPADRTGDVHRNQGQREVFKQGIKRDVFKQGVKPEGGMEGGAEGGGDGHKRHRRRRRKGRSGFGEGRDMGATGEKTSGFAGDKQVETAVVKKETIEHKKVVKDEKKVEAAKEHENVSEEKKEAEAVKPIEPESIPPELPVAPINPFSSFSPELPPMSYETRYSDKDDNKDGKIGKQKFAASKDEGAGKSEPIDTEIPVNPFETSIFPDEPFGAKPLDEKPLEKKEKTDHLKESEKSLKKDFDEVKEDFSVKESEPWIASMPEVSVAEPVVAEVIEAKKSSVAESIVAEVVQEKNMPEVKAVDSIEEFKSEFFKVLESAGITKGKIIVFASLFVVAVVALLFFVFGWYKVFIFWGDEVSEEVESEDVEEAGGAESVGSGETENVAAGHISDDSSGNIFGIVSSYIFGLEYQPAVENITAEPITTWGSTSGLTASFVFGEVGDFKKHRFSEYAELIRSLKNISETDVYKLLDLAVDRRAAINDHLNLMKGLISKAESTAVFIESEIEMVRAEYMLLNDQRAVYEEQFFSEVQAMNGDSAYNSMEKFVDSSQQVVALKAYFSANQSILKLVNDYRNILEPRYKDISVNIEALIKGVKVFEVPQSNIDAIIILTPPNQ